MGILSQEDAPLLDPAAFEGDWHGGVAADAMCRRYGLKLHELYRMRKRLGLEPRERVPYEDPSSVEDLQ